MNRDFSFIKLYSNFADAILNENPPISKLRYQGFIQLRTDETFLQTSNSDVDIVFVGGYSAGLIDGCGNVKLDVTSNFYFDGFEDANGIKQISFEFGMVNQDFWAKPLHLKLTDLVNGNIYYSNSFLITNFNSDISTRVDYWDISDEYKRSVRLVNCFDQTPQNELSSKQYTTSFGTRVNYKQITTYLRKYLIDSLDYFINDRLPILINSDNVYLNGIGAVISDLKTEERIVDSNLLKAEFIVNPQNTKYDWQFQIYEPLQVIERNPVHQSVLSSTDGLFSLTFNKNISFIGGASIELYKDGVSVTEATTSVIDNILYLDYSFYTFTNGNYSIVVPSGIVFSNGEIFNGYAINEWTFTIGDGYYDETYYDENYYLT